MHARVRSSLRTRFSVVFGALAVVPLMAVSLFLGNRTTTELENQSLDLQQEIAAGVSDQVLSMIGTRERELAVLDLVVGVASADPDAQRSALRGLLAAEPMYQELTIAAPDGSEQIRVSRGAVVLPTDLGSVAGSPAFRRTATTGGAAFGPVEFDDALRQPTIEIGYPLIDRRTGQFEAFLLATVTFKPIWELLGSLDGDRSGSVYLVDGDGLVVAHRDPAVVLRGTSIETARTDGRATGLSGEAVIASVADIPLGSETLYVIAEQPLELALAVATNAGRVTLIITAFALLAVIGAVLLVTQRIVRPIEEVAASARRVAGGDRTRLITVRGNDEITDLSVAFNQMTLQLDDLIETLERRVADRTGKLEEAAGVQRELIAELEMGNAELTLVKERLEELIRSKSEFLGAVSHELRTPLTSVVGFASVVRDEYEDLDERERVEMITRIADQAQDMADIINDLLAAARLEGDSLEVYPEMLELNDAIDRTVDVVPDTDSRLVRCSGSVDAYADPVRVRQILRNLLVNAVRYGNGEVEVVAAKTDDGAVVEVRDRGAGVPKDQWEIIFDPYRRASNQSSNPASVGLGLSVSRSLARRMGGDLTYRYEGGMSIFTLTLPSGGAPIAKAGSAGVVGSRR